MVDCAGEFDSGGILVEAINAKVKSVISKKCQNVKLLFVCSQSSLESSGAYGKNFKEALDKNSIFLNDINFFKNSIGFIVTHASRNKNTLEFIKKSLDCILNQHDNLDRYKETVSHILKLKRIEMFSKPSSEDEVGELYKPPVWNIDQNDKILKMISKLQFTKVPYKNYFNVSVTSYVKNGLCKALNVIKSKIKSILQEAIKDNLKPKLLYAIELKAFVNYINNLMVLDKEQSLKEYINLLQLNKFFKISLDKQSKLNQLEEEMMYINQFCNDGLDANDKTLDKWGMALNLKNSINEVIEEAYTILNRADFNFCKIENGKNIKTKGCFGVKSEEMHCMINELIRAYKRQNEIITKKSIITSEYYYDEKVDEFERFNTTKYFEEQEIEYEYRVPKASHDAILFFMSLGKGVGESIHRGIPIGIYEGCKFFCEKDYVEIRKQMVDVEKENKVPVYKKVIKRFFDENKYLEDIKSNNDYIESLNLRIDQKLSEMNQKYNYLEKIWKLPYFESIKNKMSSGDLNEKIENAMAEDMFIPETEIEKKVLDIKLKWKKAEYEYYFVLEKKNVLNMQKYFEEYNVEKSSYKNI